MTGDREEMPGVLGLSGQAGGFPPSPKREKPRGEVGRWTDS